MKLQMTSLLSIFSICLSAFTAYATPHLAHETVQHVMRAAIAISEQKASGETGDLSTSAEGSPYNLRLLVGAEPSIKYFTIEAANVPKTECEKINALSWPSATISPFICHSFQNMLFIFNNTLETRSRFETKLAALSEEEVDALMDALNIEYEEIQDWLADHDCSCSASPIHYVCPEIPCPIRQYLEIDENCIAECNQYKISAEAISEQMTLLGTLKEFLREYLDEYLWLEELHQSHLTGGIWSQEDADEWRRLGLDILNLYEYYFRAELSDDDAEIESLQAQIVDLQEQMQAIESKYPETIDDV